MEKSSKIFNKTSTRHPKAKVLVFSHTFGGAGNETIETELTKVYKLE